MATKDEGAFWSIIGYLLSGFLIWGGLGLLADHFLGTRILFLVGMLMGMVASLFLVWIRFVKE
ncbi:hypothetical protein LBMAG09_06920 [Actinomycetes bacterium]|nr:hypothetical protein LBMAG09_06920 [Actinomycetes bacterium]